SQLDNKALQDLSGLIDVLRWLEAEKRSNKLLLMGFSDGVGGFDSNMKLAAARAQSVRQQLIANSHNQGVARFIEVHNFGPLLPVGCDGSEEGKQKNRRVEIWLRGLLGRGRPPTLERSSPCAFLSPALLGK